MTFKDRWTQMSTLFGDHLVSLDFISCEMVRSWRIQDKSLQLLQNT